MPATLYQSAGAFQKDGRTRTALTLCGVLLLGCGAAQAEQEPGFGVAGDQTPVQENTDREAVRAMLQSAGIAPESGALDLLLQQHPEILDVARSVEAEGAHSAAFIAPAKFEVVERDQIYGDTSITEKYAGGRFSSALNAIDVLLNYTSILGGVSWENFAVSGTSNYGKNIGKLAVESEYTSTGVFGSTTTPYDQYVHPLVTGVWGETNQAHGVGVRAINNGAGAALLAQGTINGATTDDGMDALDNHVAIIENDSGVNTHVLALSMPMNSVLSAADNFVTFYHQGVARGAIEGNSAGNGVNYVSGSADFAEWLEKRSPAEPVQPGSVVGIAAGKVSTDLSGAERIGVISTAPAFTGNDPGVAQRDGFALVAMLGQVPVKVAGVVHSGDFIVASGRNDGIGVAIAEAAMRAEDFRLLVGRASESSDTAEVKTVRTMVGVGAEGAYAVMARQEQRIAVLETALTERLAEVDGLAARLGMLSERLEQLRVADSVVQSQPAANGLLARAR